MVYSEGDDEGRIHDDVVFFFSCRFGVVIVLEGFASANEADHRGAATAVIGIHSETNHAWGGLIFQTQRALASRAADDVERHGVGRGIRRWMGGNALGGVGLWLDLERGRAHGVDNGRDRNHFARQPRSPFK